MDEIAGAQRHPGQDEGRASCRPFRRCPSWPRPIRTRSVTPRPIDAVAATNFANGIGTWDQDAVNVTNVGAFGRPAPVNVLNGTGVYVAILDTGLLPTWRQYFPQERIADEFAKSFGGGGGENGNVSEQPNKWEQRRQLSRHPRDQHGPRLSAWAARRSTGRRRMATVIPVKVLNQNGSGWSSTIARGIMYIRDLKLGAARRFPGRDQHEPGRVGTRRGREGSDRLRRFRPA